MTTTLGEALTGGDDSTSFLEDPSIKTEYDKARTKLDKERKSSNRGELDTGALKKAFLKALDIALDDILGRAWGGWEKLREYADPNKTPPDDTNRVAVSDHTIEALHKPSVDIVLHGVPVHSFDFEVAVQLDVQGVILEVQGGAITAIQLGSLKLGGKVMLGDIELLKKNVAQVTLPDVMHLAKPIPIRRPRVGKNPSSRR